MDDGSNKKTKSGNHSFAYHQKVQDTVEELLEKLNIENSIKQDAEQASVKSKIHDIYRKHAGDAPESKSIDERKESAEAIHRDLMDLVLKDLGVENVDHADQKTRDAYLGALGLQQYGISSVEEATKRLVNEGKFDAYGQGSIAGLIADKIANYKSGIAKRVEYLTREVQNPEYQDQLREAVTEKTNVTINKTATAQEKIQIYQQHIQGKRAIKGIQQTYVDRDDDYKKAA